MTVLPVTRAVLLTIMPSAESRLMLYQQPLNDSMEIHQIDTKRRVAAFLAQLAHESGELRYVVEIASGSAYEGRADLGNTEPGDGVKFKGRGPIQITGRDNYRLCSRDLYGDERLLETPELLERPFDGCMAAGWFWQTKNLNEVADAGNFERITRIINGGLTGFAERVKYYERALGAL